MRRRSPVRFRTITAQRWTVSLVELRQPNRSEAVSGGAMDRVVVRKRIDKRILIGGAAAAALLLILAVLAVRAARGFDVGQRATGCASRRSSPARSTTSCRCAAA